METLQYLITKIFRFAIPVVLIAGLIYFVFVKYTPDFSFMLGGGSLSDLLPDPKLTPEIKPYVLDSQNVKIDGTIVGINKNTTSGISYVTVDKKGNLIYYKLNPTSNTPNTSPDFSLTKKNYSDSSYIRNLSIFSNGHIYTGLTFTGDAKNTMFKNGVFQVLVIDRFGKIIDVENVIASKNGAPAGWTKFTAKINGVLPVKVPCSLIFRPAAGATDSYNGVYVQVPEVCN